MTANRRRRRDEPTFFFSFRSPYSWLAYRDLLARYPDVADRLRWVPYWEPDAWTSRLLTEARGRFVYTAMSREKHLYVLRDVRRLAAERGLAVRWPVDRDPCWEVSHLPYLRAASIGLGRAYVDRVYRARWEQGRDISDRRTISEIGDEVGLPSAADAADDPVLRAQGAQALLLSGQLGVFGVPFFVGGGDMFWGLDRLAPFADALRGTAVSTAMTELPGDAEALVAAGTPTPGGETGHAGGCG